MNDYQLIRKLARETGENFKARVAELSKQRARNPFGKLHPWPVVYDASQWERVVDSMPRKPYKFLAMVAECERKREVRKTVNEKKAAGRLRYQKRHRQPVTPAPKPTDG